MINHKCLILFVNYIRTPFLKYAVVDIHDEDNWISWIDRLSMENYLVVDDFISDEELLVFRSFFKEQLSQESFAKAGIGTADQFQVKKEIRGDYIKWIDREEDERIHPFFNRVDVVISQLNRYCYLSLSGSEFHLAHYPAGTFYKCHLDQLQYCNKRLISVILYLNEAWQTGDGGELKIYLENKEEIIAPLAKRVVFMRSNLMKHEVLITHKDRYSITGWLLYKPVSLGFL